MRAADPTIGRYRIDLFCTPTAPGDPHCFSKTFDPFFFLWEIMTYIPRVIYRVTKIPQISTINLIVCLTELPHLLSPRKTCWAAPWVWAVLADQLRRHRQCLGLHTVVNLVSKALLSRNSARTTSTSHPAEDENILATEQHCRLKLSKVRAKAYIPRKKRVISGSRGKLPSHGKCCVVKGCSPD